MPTPYRKAYQPFERCLTLADVARRGQLIRMRCGLCSKTTYFLPADLASIVGPSYCAYDPPFPCGRCKRDDYISIELHDIAPGDYGQLIVRRPVERVVTQKWKSVKLGD